MEALEFRFGIGHDAVFSSFLKMVLKGGSNLAPMTTGERKREIR
jgi:hypothetical protein